MKALILALFATLVAMSATAGEYLEPDTANPPPPVLARAFAPDVVLRAVTIPSFQQVYALGIARKDNGTFALFGVVDPYLPLRPRPASSAPLLCEMPLGARPAQDFLNVWTQMLRITQPPPSHMTRADGNTTRFAVLVGGRWRTGQTWSPAASSRAGAMVGIVLGLREACTQGSAEALDRAHARATELLERLPHNHR